MADAKVSALTVATVINQADLIYLVQSSTSKTAAASLMPVNLTWRDEGTDIATPGQVTKVDFVGSGVSAAFATDKVTVTISAAPPSASFLTLATSSDLTSERVLTLNAIGGLSAVDAGAGSTYTLKRQSSRLFLHYANDFGNVAADWLLATSNSGTGSGVSTSGITSQTGHPGIARFATGTTNTGRAGMIGSASMIRPYSGNTLEYEALIYIPTLSDGTETYAIWLGFLNSIAAEPTAGAYFRYSSDANSGKFEIRVANGGAPSATDTTVTANAATWYRLALTMTGTTSVDWAIYDEDGGTALGSGTVNSGLPSGANDYGVGFGTLKSAGTTSRETYIDLLEVRGALDSAKRGGS